MHVHVSFVSLVEYYIVYFLESITYRVLSWSSHILSGAGALPGRSWAGLRAFYA